MSKKEETISKERLQGEISNFIKSKKYNEKAERTIKQYQRVLNDFSNWLPCIDIVTKEVIIDYKYHLKDLGLKTITINNKIVIINSYLHYLE
ncbi:MAG: phage integrase N-terminal SAM-like domain-containing protein, partial [Coprobacillus sp.]